MQRILAVMLAVIVPALVSAGSDEVQFQGGTLAIKNGTKLKVDLADPSAAVFRGNSVVRVPWTGIKSIEYGQTASRRVTSAILLSPIALFSKARKHYVNLEWLDDQGQAQAAAFRADKSNFRAILTALRAKSGVDVMCGDTEAAKYFNCKNSAELMEASKKK